jgi:dienelactone hydrolase
VGDPGLVGDGLAPDRTHGPYPVVMFTHGYGVTPDFYTALLERWAHAGYVVVAPTYPILSGEPAGPSDVVGWDDTFTDTSFVLSRVLALGASNDPILGGALDPQRVAVAGHSDGAYIAFGVGFQAWREDPRVRAVISLAAHLGGAGGVYQADGRPFLHFLSEDDEYNPFDSAVAWDRAYLGSPRWTIGLLGADHAPPYRDPSDPHFEVVAAATVDFLDATLKGRPDGLDAMAAVVAANPSLAAPE